MYVILYVCYFVCLYVYEIDYSRERLSPCGYDAIQGGSVHAHRRDNFRNLLESIVQPLFPNVYDFAFINNDFIQVRLRQKGKGQGVINTEVADTRAVPG